MEHARLTLVAIAVAACQADGNYAGTTFQCDVSSECPDGQSCVTGYCVEPDGCPPGWADCSLRRRLKLTFDNPGSALAGFPVPVFLDATRIDYTATQDQGQDLRFVDPDGTPLAHEIEVWNEQGTSVVWVGVPQIDASTADFAWLYYNSAGAGDGQNAAAVWSSYQAVWHLGGDPGGPAPHAVDSAMFANNGVSQGAMTSNDSVAAKLARGIEFDGVDDGIVVPSSPSLDITGSAITLSAWVKTTAVQPVDAGVIIKSSQVTATLYNYQLGVQTGNHANFRVRTAGGTTPGLTYLDGATLLEVNRWYYLTGVYDGAIARVYVDAVEDGTDPRTGTIISTPEPVVIGRRAINDNRFFTGVIDEGRIANVARSPGWISAEYRAMTDAFVMYGVEDRLP